jgi:hypothetical protein
MTIEKPNLLDRIQSIEERLINIEKRISNIEDQLNRFPLRHPPQPGPIRPPGPPGPKPEPFRF